MGHQDQILQFSSARHATQPTRVCEYDTVSSFLSGTSNAITQLRAQIRRVPPYFRTASLTCEPGCGDEAVARALHEMSPLRDSTFVVLSVAEAEHRFTSEAPPTDEGLLYLPDAEKLSRAAQDGLLRMLCQQNAGSPRVVAFVGRGLKPFISAGFFSPELAGSLASLRIALPTLRERAGALPLLVHDRLQQYDRDARHRPLYLSDEFLNAAVRYSWPGNLHQLNDAVDWLLEHKAGGTLRSVDLLAALESISQTPSNKPAEPRLVPLHHIVQEHIRSVLMACNGNKLRASEILGISRSTLYRMLDSAEAPDSLLLAG